MEKVCKQCQESFDVDESDLAFYERVSPVIGGERRLIPPPSLCPDCRCQRRLHFRNFFNLYKRSSSFSGEPFITMYPDETPFPVYSIEEWWGDGWTGLDYGLPWDPERGPFEIMRELQRTVPRMNVMNVRCENCGYCNFSFQSSDCYLVFGNVVNEDCYYGHIVWHSNSCFDCLYVYRCELCFECVDCLESYDLAFCVGAENCSNSRFLINCSGCRDCFACVGLHDVQYCYLNEQLSEAEYRERVGALDLGNRDEVEELLAQVQALHPDHTVKCYHGYNCEDCSGDYLYNSQNAKRCFDIKKCEDAAYCATVEEKVDCHDMNFSVFGELCFNTTTGEGYNLICCHTCANSSSNLLYCDNCFSCKHCFGCVGLKSEEYCVFNKQYTKEEYERLVPEIISWMEERELWGEFFPLYCSPFAYNQTMAEQYFPLDPEGAMLLGSRWADEAAVAQGNASGSAPLRLADATYAITNEVFGCSGCGKGYRVIKQELDFARQLGVPLQTECFNCRHERRMKIRNPRQLWQRDCASCGTAVETTYASSRPEQVVCEKCYHEYRA